MSGERISTLYDNQKDFEDALEAAEAANPKGDAGKFVSDIRARYDRYGIGMFLSSKQKRWLESIGGERV